MAERNAVGAARPFDGPVARGEDNSMALIGGDDFGAGLRARNVFHQHELAAIPIAVLLAEHNHKLQRKRDLSIQILMQAVVAAGFVMKQERRWLLLAGVVTAAEKFLVFKREWLIARIQLRVPAICDFCKMRVRRSTKRLYCIRQGITKILVVAFAEAVPLHDHVTAKRIFLREECSQRFAFLRSEERPDLCVAGFREMRSG